jgi:hypothetical protein
MLEMGVFQVKPVLFAMFKHQLNGPPFSIDIQNFEALVLIGHDNHQISIFAVRACKIKLVAA